MTEEIKQKLIFLAQKYENCDFFGSDPIALLTDFKNQNDVEVASFIASLLSFGKRSQFIPKITELFSFAQKSGCSLYLWVKNGFFKTDFYPNKNDDEKFYRFYSYSDIKEFLAALQNVLIKYETLESFVKSFYESRLPGESANDAVFRGFHSEFRGVRLVPNGKTSANKRLNLFLRWMVRSSPVDKGMWKWFSKSDLVIPLDTHVLQQAKKMNLLSENCGASAKTAKLLTEQLKLVWPDDPCKGDFALFGLGVDN